MCMELQRPGMRLAPLVIANNRWPDARVGICMKETMAVIRAVKMSIAVAAAACVAGCANASSGLTSPSPLAVATPSVPSSCAVPGAPENLSAEVTGTTVSLSWSAVGDASDYVVLVGSTPGSSETVLTNASEAHRSIDDLPRGTHFARVHAHNWCGTSASSEPIRFTVG
jgi:hypothetical protein